jgi:pimeloyl-ACP methyl ester carboxylesterase
MLVLLVHGLGRTPLSLFGLAAALRRAGHRTRFFGYSPTFERLPRIVRRLANLLRSLARVSQPVSLVGHSLGGVLLRLALDEVPELQVHHFIMLGTPNRPPRMARLAWRWLPFRLLTGDCGHLLANAERFAIIPKLRVPFTVIAGTAGPRGRFSPFGNDPNDGVVAVAEATIDHADVIQLPVLHTVMMDSRAVRNHIVAMLKS